MVTKIYPTRAHMLYTKSWWANLVERTCEGKRISLCITFILHKIILKILHTYALWLKKHSEPLEMKIWLVEKTHRLLQYPIIFHWSNRFKLKDQNSFYQILMRRAYFCNNIRRKNFTKRFWTVVQKIFLVHITRDYSWRC